ncbi:hypothetical protein N7474_007535 [Penicillium riverlandense]|uniref:uncharacterized protein n=1 Tax=Penicillium riverlandense TaxID=1903569 RepID=UPI00254808B9|nr:uncharacterized protein N7474_007535 [Penicillium riverlandense]KAJ5815758.1 hypothetical protein N7474_007535 [Penicillium riverlandense]
MCSLKQLFLLSFMLLAVSGSKGDNRTIVGIETERQSRALNVVMDECFDVEEDEVFTVSVHKKCRVFSGPLCTGRNTLLTPGDHTSKYPVPIESIYCHSS